MLTFAQNFEDVLLARLFKEQTSGFYVDVGAWHPTDMSVTKHFYDRGWSGINIEPVRRQVELFDAARPRDTNLCLALSDRKGVLRFYECTDDTALSTADELQAAMLAQQGHQIRSYDVESVTLADIAALCAGRTVDFVKIDAEGCEERIIRSTDWSMFRPRALLIEATRPAQSLAGWDEVDALRNWDRWEPLVLAAGYVFARYDGLNRFYLREDDAHLARRLALPPGIYDQLEFPATELARRLSEENAELRRERESLEAEFHRVVGAAELERRARDGLIEGLRRDLDEKEQVIQRLAREAVASDVQRQARETVLDDLQRGLVEKEEVIQRLAREVGAIEADRRAHQSAVEHLRRDMAGKEAVIERLARENEEIKRDRGRRDEEIGKLVAAIGVERRQHQITIDRLGQDLAMKEAAIKRLISARPSKQPIADRLVLLRDLQLRMSSRILTRARRTVRALVGYRLGQFVMHAPRSMSLPPRYERPRGASGTLRISVITPVFNQAQFIAATIESVASQNYPALEHIVMDGGSVDGSKDIIERHLAKLARFESGCDSGQANAINKGMAHARGDVLGWLNADDLLLPGAIEYIAHFFEHHADIDVIYGNRIIIDRDGLEIGRWILPKHDDDILSWADYVPQETLFWRRRIWERVGARLDESFQFAMDWDLLVRFRDAGARFARLPRYLGAFRVHDDQKTTKEIGTKGAAEMDRIRLRCLGYLPSYLEINRSIAPYMLRHVVLHNLDKVYSRY